MSERFTVSLEADLAEAFDAYIRRRGSNNRSEAVRDLIREALAREQLDSDPHGGCVGVLTYLYDHHERELSKRLTETHHAHYNLTVTTLHMHLDHDHCLEAVLLKGSATEVQALSDAVISRPGVRHGRLYRIPFEDPASIGEPHAAHEHAVPGPRGQHDHDG